MVWEVASIKVKDGMDEAFEAGVQEAVEAFRAARGCLSFELRRSIEEPRQYQLIVGWETVEDHMVHFRGSPGFQTWRRLVGRCFEAPPVVEHTQQVLVGF